MTEKKLKKKGGRPAKQENEKRECRYNLRLTTAEDIIIRDQAAVAGLKPAEFLRRRALNYRVPSPANIVERELIYELNKIGVNINQIALAANTNRSYKGNVAAVYTKLNEVLEKVALAYDTENTQ